MLTDEDLTRQLAAAFREDAGELTYDRPTPRARTRPAWARPGLVAVPAVGVAAAAVLVFGSLDDPASRPVPQDTTAAPAPSSPAGGTGTATGPETDTETVTEEISLAGMTFSYERGVDEASIDDQLLRVYDPGELPAWAEPIELEEGASAQVWVGQDPADGDVSMFVESPERWAGTLTGLASPTLTVEQMTSLARTGRLD